jgi:hypothetical protein
MWPLSHADVGHFQCLLRQEVDCVWNVMAHAQKPDLIFRRNGRVHLNRQGACASAVVMLDTPCYEVVCSVLATHSIRLFPLHFPLPCVTVCHHISAGFYHTFTVTSMYTYTICDLCHMPNGVTSSTCCNCKHCTFSVVVSTINTHPIYECCTVTSSSPCIKIWMHKVFLITAINYSNREHWLWN